MCTENAIPSEVPVNFCPDFDSVMNNLGFEAGPFDDVKEGIVHDMVLANNYPTDLVDAYSIAPLRTIVDLYRLRNGVYNISQPIEIFSQTPTRPNAELWEEIKVKMMAVEEAGLVGIPLELTDRSKFNSSQSVRDIVGLYEHYSGKEPIGPGSRPRSRHYPPVLAIGVDERPIPTTAEQELARRRKIVANAINNYYERTQSDEF